MLSTGTRIAGISRRQSTMLLIGVGIATLAGLTIVIMVILYSHLLQPASTHLKPCNDFYQYSCAWWFGGIPLYGSKTWKQTRVIKNNTKELLSNNSISTKGNKEVFENAKKMYFICTQNWESEKESGLKYVTGIANQFHWPIIQSQTLEDSDSIDFANIIRIIGVIHKLGLSDGILDIDVARSIYFPHSYHILIREKKVTLVERIHRYDHGATLEKDKEMLRKFISFAIDQIHGHPNDKETVEDIDEMLKFREILLKTWLKVIGNTEAETNYQEEMKLATLSSYTNINFSRVLNIIFDGRQFSPDEIVIVKNRAYIMQLGAILQNTPTRTVINLLVWNALEPYLWGTNRALAGINDKSNPENHHIFYKKWTNSNEIFSSSDKIPRWEKCVEAVSFCFPNTLHQAYGDYFIGKGMIESLTKFTNRIVHTFIRQIDSWNWLSGNSKQFIKQKAENIKRSFGIKSITEFEIQLEKSIASKDTFVANLLECRKITTKLKLRALTDPKFIYDPSNTMYGTDVATDRLTNSITILSGVSQPPFYNPMQSSASNFGALGTLIGSALLSILSPEALKFDDKGHYNSSGWVEDANQIYKKLSNCFVDQYNEYCQNKHCRNFGGRTLDTNFANEGGLKLAYMAYKSWRLKNPHEESSNTKLAFVSFTQEQLFFLSFAMMYCANDNPLIVKYLMTYEKQSPPNLLVNGPLSNMVEFSKAFNCPEKSAMKRTDSCELW